MDGSVRGRPDADEPASELTFFRGNRPGDVGAFFAERLERVAQRQLREMAASDITSQAAFATPMAVCGLTTRAASPIKTTRPKDM
jgi:hypothetical protein